MKLTFIKTPLVTLSLLLSVGFAQALDDNAKASHSVAGKAIANSKFEATEEPGKKKVIPKTKLVDINSATKEELKKLPGITEEEAAKIVAGRPYGSKTWLIGPKFLTEEKYLSIKDKIIAKQPYKDAAKNAAFFNNKLKE